MFILFFVISIVLAPLELASVKLLNVFSTKSSSVSIQITGVSFVSKAIGPCLSSPALKHSL